MSCAFGTAALLNPYDSTPKATSSACLGIIETTCPYLDSSEIKDCYPFFVYIKEPKGLLSSRYGINDRSTRPKLKNADICMGTGYEHVEEGSVEGLKLAHDMKSLHMMESTTKQGVYLYWEEALYLLDTQTQTMSLTVERPKSETLTPEKATQHTFASLVTNYPTLNLFQYQVYRALKQAGYAVFRLDHPQLEPLEGGLLEGATAPCRMLLGSIKRMVVFQIFKCHNGRFRKSEPGRLPFAYVVPVAGKVDLALLHKIGALFAPEISWICALKSTLSTEIVFMDIKSA